MATPNLSAVNKKEAALLLWEIPLTEFEKEKIYPLKLSEYRQYKIQYFPSENISGSKAGSYKVVRDYSGISAPLHCLLTIKEFFARAGGSTNASYFTDILNSRSHCQAALIRSPPDVEIAAVQAPVQPLPQSPTPRVEVKSIARPESTQPPVSDDEIESHFAFCDNDKDVEKAQIELINTYAAGSIRINRILAGTRRNPARHDFVRAQLVVQAIEALRPAAFEPATYFRGAPFELYKDLKAGDVYVLNTIMSTSSELSTANDFAKRRSVDDSIILEVKGRGRKLFPYDTMENEFVFLPRTRFKVLAVKHLAVRPASGLAPSPSIKSGPQANMYMCLEEITADERACSRREGPVSTPAGIPVRIM